MSEYIVGRNPVIEHLQHGAQEIEKIWIAEGTTHSRIRRIIAMAGEAGVPIKRCTRRELDRIEPRFTTSRGHCPRQPDAL